MKHLLNFSVTSVIAFLCGSGVLALTFTPRSHAASAAARPADSAQDVYLDKCAVCHAKDGSGNTVKGRKLKVKDLRGPDAQKLSEAEMIEIVSKGKGKDMDGFQKELGTDMIKQIVEYYRGLAKK